MNRKETKHRVEGLLLSLLRKVLWDRPIKESLELQALLGIMKLGKAHTIAALVAHPILRNEVDLQFKEEEQTAKRNFVFQLLQQDQVYRKTYVHFNKVVKEFATLMEEAGIRYVIFKGLSVASHYRQPYLRTMGDIDFYVPFADYESAVGIIEDNLNVEILRNPLEKHDTFDYKGIHFEMHYRIETFGRAKHQRYFDEWMEEDILQGRVATFLANDQYVPTPNPEADIVIVFKHLFNHLLIEGVGLRQVVDLAVLLQHYHKEVDVPSLQHRLRKIGYLKAFEAFVALLERHLGLPCASTYATLSSKDYRAGDQLFAMVMESGNFGRLGTRHQTEGWQKSLETAQRAFHHCRVAFRLIPSEMTAFIPHRIGISLKKHLQPNV